MLLLIEFQVDLVGFLKISSSHLNVGSNTTDRSLLLNWVSHTYIYTWDWLLTCSLSLALISCPWTDIPPFQCYWFWPFSFLRSPPVPLSVWLTMFSCRYEEYIDYVFPEEAHAHNLKILEKAREWKRQKLASGAED